MAASWHWNKRTTVVFAAVIILIVIAGWVLQRSDEFRLPGSQARFYTRTSDLCRRMGWSSQAFKLMQLASSAADEHLKRGITSGKVAVITFHQPQKYDMSEFVFQVTSYSKKEAIGLLMVRPVPTANAPAAYEVLVYPSSRSRMQSFIRSLEQSKKVSLYE